MQVGFGRAGGRGIANLAAQLESGLTADNADSADGGRRFGPLLLIRVIRAIRSSTSLIWEIGSWGVVQRWAQSRGFGQNAGRGLTADNADNADGGRRFGPLLLIRVIRAIRSSTSLIWEIGSWGVVQRWAQSRGFGQNAGRGLTADNADGADRGKESKSHFKFTSIVLSAVPLLRSFTTRFQSSFTSLKLRSKATCRPVMLR